MYKIYQSIVLLSLSLIIFAGCKDATSFEENNQESIPSEILTGKTSVSLTPDQRQTIGLKVGTFKMLNMDKTIKATGTLGLPPNSFSSVSPKAEGFIRNSNTYVEGSYIKKGATLAYLEHPDFIKMQQAYLEIIATLSYLNKDLDRQKALVKANAGISKNIEKLESDIAIQAAKKAGMEKQLLYLGIDANNISTSNIHQRIAITSPISGYITHIDMHNGMYVRPDQTLLEVINDDHLHLELKVFEKDISMLQPEQKIVYTVPALGNKHYEGEVHIIGKEFDKDSKTLTVHGHLAKERPIFIKDLYIEADIWIGDQMTKALPTEAIAVDGVDTYIYYTLSEREEEAWKFQRLSVICSKEHQGYVAVKLLAPIPENAKIVLNGAYYLGTMSGSIE